MPTYIPVDTSDDAVAHHEAGHLVVAWLCGVPFESATVDAGLGSHGAVSGGNYLAPQQLDLNVRDNAERRRLVAQLSGECYILMAGLVSETFRVGTLVEALMMPETDDPTEDTAKVRLNIRALSMVVYRRDANRAEQEEKQLHFQIRTAHVVCSAFIWNLIHSIARLLIERRRIVLSDYLPLLQPHATRAEVIAARDYLGIPNH